MVVDVVVVLVVVVEVAVLVVVGMVVGVVVVVVLLASAGHEPLEPVQVSATSQTPLPGRQVSPARRNVQCAVQQDVGAPFTDPWSQSSPASTAPLPQIGVVTGPLHACRKWEPK